MMTVLSITEARTGLAAAVKKITKASDHIVLESNGSPVAAVVSLEMLESMLDGIEILRRKKTSRNAVKWDDVKHKYGV